MRNLSTLANTPSIKHMGTLETIRGNFKIMYYYPLGRAHRDYYMVNVYREGSSNGLCLTGEAAFEQWLEAMQAPAQIKLAL
jgi:hypothetical protein